MRHVRTVGALVGVVAAAALGPAFGERTAHACGGEFVPPNENDSVVTDHRMILAIGEKQSTLYDEIEFTGAPASFAWVLPIKGAATVALSADILFASLDQLTSSQVVEPPTNCPPPPSCGEFEDGFGSSVPSASEVDAGVARSAVTVTAQAQVGPYETVQLHSTDPTALATWLSQHGYSIPSAVAPIVSAYVTDGFDFLAMKLAPGKGVSAMQPVRVTTAGASPVLPLRMVAAGTGTTTGITLWVVASGRYEPQNFPFFVIEDAELAWDWNSGPGGASNYETVRLAQEAKLGGKGWQVESSLDLNEYSVTQLVQGQGNFGAPAPTAGGYLPVGDGGAEASDGGSADAGTTDGGDESVAQVENADFDALFVGAANGVARVTRIRSDLAHAALTADLTLQASSDQHELSNVHNTTSQIGEPECPIYNDSCQVTGTAPRSQAEASGTTSGGGCSTSATSSSVNWQGGLAAFLGFAGLGVVRARRKRSPV